MADHKGDSMGWTFYQNRPEWKDVTPIAQDDENVPVVKIAYSEKFNDVYGYLRAVMKINEVSERAFALTKDAVLLNAANYTVWHYRRVLIDALRKSWDEELRFVADLIDEHPKNYQVWHHRRCVVQKLAEQNAANLTNELEFTKRVFDDDAKNYHCWEYRQFLLTHFGAFDQELEFTESLIKDDVFNNSAWNQRFFVLTHQHFRPAGEELRKAAAAGQAEWDAAVSKLRATVTKEIDFVCRRIELAAENESAWSYLRGLVDTFCRLVNAAGKQHQHSTLSDFGELLEFANATIKRLNSSDASASLAHEFAFEFLALQLERERATEAAGEKAEKIASSMREHLATLNEIDPIRAEWWSYLQKTNKL